MADPQVGLSVGFQCLRCGVPCEGSLSGDLLVAACPTGDLRYAFTVRAPGAAAGGAPLSLDAASEKPDPLVGRTLGPCRLVARLGTEGGLPLYQGLDTARGEPRAVRVLQGPEAGDAARFNDFVRAAKLSAAARHAALAGASHLARFPDGVFAVFPALEGKSFEQAVRGSGRMGLPEALRIIRRLAEALAALHERGVIHRNVGPHSVFLLPNGEPLLRNFAFALEADRWAGPYEVAGQLGYLAPEQVLGAPLDARADLYALGALLAFALVGEPPFAGATPAEAIRAQLRGLGPAREALAICAPPDVVELVASLVSETPAQRPPSAQALAERLASLGSALPPQAQPAAALAFDEEKITLAEPAPEPVKPPAAPRRLASRPLAPPAEGEGGLALAEAPEAAGREEGRARRLATFELKPGEVPRPAGPAPAQSSGATMPRAEAIGAEAAMLDANLNLESSGSGANGGSKAVEAIILPEEEPGPKLLSPKIIVLAAVAVVALAAFLVTQFVSCDGKPAPKAQPVDPKGGPPGRPGRKVLTAAEKAAAEARRDFEAIQAAAARKGPKDHEELLRLCEAFLEKRGGDELAAEVAKIRDGALNAQLEREAEAELRAIEAGSRGKGKTLALLLEEFEAFLKKYPGTQTAKKAEEQRGKVAAQHEAAAKDAAAKAQPQMEKALKAEAYGAALSVLEGLAAAHAGTKAGAEAAAAAAELRRKLANDFKQLKAEAEALLRRAAFGDALARLDAPLNRWQFDEARTEAAQLAAAARQSRARTVEAYGAFLATYDGQVGVARFEEARAAAAQAAEKANDPALRQLLLGKAEDAALLARLVPRFAAGAKAEQAKAAEGDGRVWLQRSASARFKAAIANPTEDGLDADMPGFKGRLAWGDLHPEQLVIFARSAPGEPSPADHCAMGLLALHGGAVGAAFEEFTKALDAGPNALAAIQGCLRRHAQGFAYVPGGQFLAGARKEPKVLESCLLGRSEVTNAEFAFFLRATGTNAPPDWKPGRDELPVANITWDEADAFARWLDMRLPGDLEWERAVRGTDGRPWPWGNAFDPSRVILARTTPGKGPALTPVPLTVARRHPRRDDFPFFHLCGNVREWTSTPALDPRGVPQGYLTVGGSAAEGEAAAAAHARLTRRPDARDPHTGFRLAWPR